MLQISPSHVKVTIGNFAFYVISYFMTSVKMSNFCTLNVQIFFILQNVYLNLACYVNGQLFWLTSLDLKKLLDLHWDQFHKALITNFDALNTKIQFSIS